MPKEKHYLTQALREASVLWRAAGATGPLEVSVDFADWRNICSEARFLAREGDAFRLDTEVGAVIVRLRNAEPSPLDG